jgi:hypothetical protein
MGMPGLIQEQTKGENLMQILWQTIPQSKILFFIGAVSFLSASVWAGSAGDLQPRVPPDRLEQAKSFINPFPPSEEFIASGKKLYEGKGWCAYCHGWEGTGAPSAGRTPPADTDIKMPTNFADAAWQAARSDGELFWVLIHGSHGTDMVPYMPQYITDKEAWQIIAYIRTFGGT